MDAQAKKALYRAKLKAQKQEKRIDSPLVRYNESDQPVCRVCDIVLKSESAWSAHQISAKHREAIKNVKANAAAATRVNNVKPEASIESPKAKPERPAELFNNQTGAPASLSKSGLPSDFFDKPETNRQRKDASNAKSRDTDKTKVVLGSAPAQVMKTVDREDKRVEDHEAKVAETINDEVKTSHTGALPEGFFDDKDADMRARGITPVKLDIKDEYKEFEKLIQEDLKEVDNRLEEEEYDAAETIEEAETVEQKTYRERVEMLKQKKMELKAARAAKRRKVSQVTEKESSDDEPASSDSDSDDALDWRAKHL